MKTTQRYIVLLICCISLITSCTHDTEVISPTGSATSEAWHWKPSDGIKQFIPAEYKDNIRAEDLELTERLLRNPKEGFLASRGNEIHIAAGSSNALPAAIASAGYGDVIVLDPGDHKQTGTLVLDKVVSISGYGANLIFSGTPTSPTLQFTSAIHIKSGAAISTIRGITFKGTDPIPGIAIFMDQTESIKILNNSFENWQFGIAAYQCRHLTIAQNHVSCNTGWQTGAIPLAEGIILSDGSHNQIVDNVIKNGVFGIFTGGSQGLDFNNYTYNCVYGQILCKVTPGVLNVNGTLVNTEGSSSNWLVMFNKSDNNFATGYLVVDGANKNFLEHNTASNNAAYDIELAGASLRFGYPTPTSFNNRVYAYGSLKVKDCGVDNKLHGGTLVDNTVDPCN